MSLLSTVIWLALLGSPVAAAPDDPVPAALREDPPLPGEPLDGWHGLDPGAHTSAEGLGLAELIRLAEDASPRLRAARAEALAARGAVRAAGRPANPSLELELEPEDGGRHTSATLELPLSDLVYAPLRAAAARPSAQSAAHRLSEEEARLRLELGRGWFDLVAAEQRLRIAQRSLEAQAAAAELAQARLDSGSATPLEHAVQVAAYQSARGELAELELARRRALVDLQRLASLPPEALSGPLALSFPELPEVPPVPTHLDEVALTRSLALAAGREEARSLERQARLLRAERGLPSLSLGAGGALPTLHEPGLPGPGELTLSAHLSLPILDRGIRAARSLQAGAAAEQARTEALADQVEARAEALRLGLWTAHARVRHEAEVVVPAWAAVGLETMRAYNAMQVGVYELLAVRRQELAAAVALVDAQHAYWTASVELEALLAGALPDALAATSSRSAGAAAAPAGGH